VSYELEEQIMSKDKYPNIFSPQLEATVFIMDHFHKLLPMQNSFAGI